MGDPSLVALHRPFAQHQYQLHSQELVEGEPPTCLFLVADRLGQVDVRQRIESVEQAEALQDRWWHRVGDASLAASSQCLLDPACDFPGVDLGLLALRIDRHDPTRAVADQVDDRIRHLQSTAVDVGLAEQCDLQALSQLALTPRLVEEHHVHTPRSVADVDVDHRATVPRDPLGHRPDRCQHERLLPRFEVGDAGFVRPVDPATGIEGDQVEEVVDADGSECRALLVADALEPADIDLGEVAVRQCVHSTPDLTRHRRGTGRAAGHHGARRPGCRRGGHRASRRSDR